ncbi:MAG: hypothetical protein IJ403_11125 [Oscillospiraceae bacterium]|nr:hypothetical protein [Oscillospiraceae bacterium]
MAIVIENSLFRLTVGEDCIAQSLVCKANGEECLAKDKKLPLFSVTQERPFNNEVKLSTLCKRTTYPANSLRREGDKLIVGFSVAPYEAVVQVQEKESYVNFCLDSFINHPTDYGHLCMDKPPATEFCLLQLPVADRENFGQWLNVSWDENTAVNVLASDPRTLIDAEKREDYHIMHATVRRDIRLQGPGVALIVAPKEQLLDCVAAVEEDFDLPRGVESRRNPCTNQAIYYTWELYPDTVEEHIRYCKAGGYKLMQVYFTSIYKSAQCYGLCGDYDYNDHYPNGAEDLKKVLSRLREEGIIPGLHLLQPHIGLKSRYVTPVADHRLHLIQHYTLAKPLGKEDTTVYVEQDPFAAPRADKRRVLQFGGELITYEGRTEERPYCFTGCTRGAYDTTVTEHPLGQIGGVLDVSEYSAVSAYLDQNTSLADEVSQKLADTYNLGFGFIYFDGSEGANAPHAYHIPNAQYSVYKKLQTAPLFCEGAAKAHFSWHMLSGANAFDIFRPEVFKEMIGVHPIPEAIEMKKDFTRVNFGWWQFWGGTGTQADQFAYSSAKAAAWDCPATMISDRKFFGENPRLYDILEVLRRWEDARTSGFFTAEQKEQMKNLEQEHILLINEQKEYELQPYFRVALSEDFPITAYTFTRGGESWAVYWHRSGEGKLKLPVNAEEIQLYEELWQPSVSLGNGLAVLPADKCRYVKTTLPMEKLVEVFQKAELL